MSMCFLDVLQERDALAIKLLETLNRCGALVWRARKPMAGGIHYGKFLLGIELSSRDRSVVFLLDVDDWNKTDWAVTLEYAPWFVAPSGAERIERILGL